jgi:hypothetical protein
MSAEIPKQSFEAMSEEQFQRINTQANELLNYTGLTPEACQKYDYIYEANQYPEVAAAGLSSIEIIVQPGGALRIDATHPPADDRQKTDLYIFTPDERQLEHCSRDSNFNEELAKLQKKLRSLRTDLPLYEDGIERARKTMIHLIGKTGDYNALISEYKDTQKFIADGRSIEAGDDELRDMLDQRASENEAKLVKLFQAVAVANPDVKEALNEYDQNMSNLRSESELYQWLDNHIEELADIQFSEPTTADPQDFIKLLEIWAAIKKNDAE